MFFLGIAIQEVIIRWIYPPDIGEIYITVLDLQISSQILFYGTLTINPESIIKSTRNLDRWLMC